MRHDQHEWIQYLQRLKDRYLRGNWPSPPPGFQRSSPRNVAVVIVNWNTADLLAALLFSLCRIVGRDQLSHIVVVDNLSSDGSRPLLQAMAEAGLVDAVFNDHQRYHGPGLNDGVRYLARLQRKPERPQDVTDFLWILDSDVIVLRDDVLHCALRAMEQAGAALCGQFQQDVMPEGYAHISSVLFDPLRVWRRGVSPFEDHGAPGMAMQQSMVRRGIKRLDFPFRSQGFLVHYGRGTLRRVAEENDPSNKYLAWAKEHSEYHFGDPNGRYLHEEFRSLFENHLPILSPQALVEACSQSGRIRLRRPYEFATPGFCAE